MNRRQFCKTSMLAAGAALAEPGAPAARAPETATSPAVTRYVSEFIARTRYQDIPPEVIALGKKSILDGLGLALAGSVSTLAPLMNRYLEALGTCAGKSGVIGTARLVSPRFAAFANGNFVTLTTTITPSSPLPRTASTDC